MDVNAIKDNNFQSLEGTWKNGNGLSLNFSKDNLTAPENYVVENTNGKLENGYLTSSLRMELPEQVFSLIPKGVTLPTVQGFVDGYG